MPEELGGRLAAYEPDLAARLELAPAEVVRARGERRRANAYATVLAAVLTVVLGGAAVATAGGLGPGRSRAGGPGDLVSAEALAQVMLPHQGEAGYALRTSLG